MLRATRTLVPSLRSWQHAAYSDAFRQHGALWFSTEASQVVDLANDKEYADALASVRGTGQRAVVDYTAKWCGPCKMIAPIYNKFSQEFKDEIKFYRVDIDEDNIASTVAEAGVASVPMFTFHKDDSDEESRASA
ncbi:hypothetical protein WJX81_004738 [Elliptochloris bilobata]|uniref:Thioredoxin domain-containing protein n=1 Tax=Elliptochloris bilobata TaxID=381761 RepID=A0AAW1QMD9_9CHLO